MEIKTSEGVGAQAGPAAGAAAGAREVVTASGASREALPCCVLREVVREGRVVTMCVATCCAETQGA